jgi:hypothetical protein
MTKGLLAPASISLAVGAMLDTLKLAMMRFLSLGTNTVTGREIGAVFQIWQIPKSTRVLAAAEAMNLGQNQGRFSRNAAPLAAALPEQDL